MVRGNEIKTKLRRRTRRHGRGTDEEVRETAPDAVPEETGARVPLGSRVAARFARVGLVQEIPELRGQRPRPGEFDS